ncbi:MAG: hypothetical protein CL578_11825 [Alteromonadaceae bacterium]|uniref:capsule biosynthesis GfcC family protein n=1 Tax=Paraglaciecola chathamensis TaxID=368405 RepID=UPI000C6B5810|nr:capsule biosynthesis GfcC family protein [Paraglaciecola agarilytica]MBN25722.1 hypothetical protein [Alteromonadaceae bacterium]|tara:strand:- start:171383 stop:172180 length:798 start_codon:yes stop_codon:yes gene_type:complete
MNKLIKITLLNLCIFSSALHAQVTLTWQNHTQSYPQAIRLTEALVPLMQSAYGNSDQTADGFSSNNISNIYWPAAALYETQESKVAPLHAQRQRLIEKLTTLHQRFANDDRTLLSAIDQLTQVVNSWQLGKRSPIKIDLDLARIQPPKNPLLTDGDYTLSAKPRSNKIFITGAVNQTQVVAHQAYQDVSHYVPASARIDKANQDYVYVIQADGRVIFAPTAYWNKQHQEVMPGSLLFVPFNTSLFHPELAEVNDLVVSLAKNRLL